MSSRLGAELSYIITAIAPVAGSIGGRWMMAGKTEGMDPTYVPFYIMPEPEHPRPVIVFHGMKGINVPYYGWAINETVIIMSVNDSISFWVNSNGCYPDPQINISESGNIITQTYSNGSHGSEVILYSIVDGGHEWFGGKLNPSCKISATDLMWDFFEKHPKKSFLFLSFFQLSLSFPL